MSTVSSASDAERRDGAEIQPEPVGPQRIRTREELRELFKRIVHGNGPLPSAPELRDRSRESRQLIERFVSDLNDDGLADFNKFFNPSWYEYHWQSGSSIIREYLNELVPPPPDDDNMEARCRESPFKEDLLRGYMPEEVAMDLEFSEFLHEFVFRRLPSERFLRYVQGLGSGNNGEILDARYCAKATRPVKIAVITKEEDLTVELGFHQRLLYHTTSLGKAEEIMNAGVRGHNLRIDGDLGEISFELDTTLAAAVGLATGRYRKDDAAVLIFEWADEEKYTIERLEEDKWRELVKKSRKGELTGGFKGRDAIYGSRCINPRDLRKGGVPHPDPERDIVAVRPNSTLLTTLISHHLVGVLVFFKMA